MYTEYNQHQITPSYYHHWKNPYWKVNKWNHANRAKHDLITFQCNKTLIFYRLISMSTQTMQIYICIFVPWFQFSFPLISGNYWATFQIVKIYRIIRLCKYPLDINFRSWILRIQNFFSYVSNQFFWNTQYQDTYTGGAKM